MAHGVLRRSTRSPIAACILSVLVLGACSADDGPSFDATSSRLDQAAAVLAKGVGGNIRGSVTDSNGNRYEIAGAWTGASVVVGTGSIEAPLRAGNRFVTATVRWVKGTTYFKRSTSASVSGPLRPFVTRTAAEKAWLRTPSGPLTTQPIAAYLPTEAVEVVQRRGGGLTEGPGRSGDREFRSKNAISLVPGLSTAHVQLWLNGRNQLVRLRFAPSGFVIEYTISDWGSPQIELPPTPEEATSLQGTVAPVDMPTTAFSKIREGSAGGVEWQLEQASGTRGSTCLRLGSTPGISLLGGNPDHRCWTRYRPEIDDVESAVRFVLVDDGSSSTEFVVAAIPKGASNVRLGYVGSTKLNGVDANTFLVAFGQAQSGPGYLGLTLDDGTKLDCGRGGIAIASDLLQSELIGNLAGTPWSCQTV